MQKFIQLEPDLYVSPQFVEDDIAAASAMGVRAIVNNRPDGEAADQLPNETAAARAHRLGMRFLYQPVPNLNVTDNEVVDAFRAALDSLPRPIVFYCRSGTRCTLLWAQANAARLGTSAVIARALEAGYNIEGAREFIESQEHRLGSATFLP